MPPSVVDDDEGVEEEEGEEGCWRGDLRWRDLRRWTAGVLDGQNDCGIPCSWAQPPGVVVVVVSWLASGVLSVLLVPPPVAPSSLLPVVVDPSVELLVDCSAASFEPGLVASVFPEG